MKIEKSNPEGTFKEPAKPEPEKVPTQEEIIDQQQKRIEQLLKMVDKRNTIIATMADKIEENGIQFVVLARNARGLLNQPLDIELPNS